MQKSAVPLATLGLAVLLMGAATGVSAHSGGYGPSLLADTEPTAQPSTSPSPLPSMTFTDNSLVSVTGVLEGEAATPTPTPSESVGAETATPAGSATPPATSSGRGSPGGDGSPPLFLGLLVMLLAGLIFTDVARQRRMIRLWATREQSGRHRQGSRKPTR